MKEIEKVLSWLHGTLRACNESVLDGAIKAARCSFPVHKQTLCSPTLFHSTSVPSTIIFIIFIILNMSGQTLGRCVCIITGSSKGFGRALAHQVSDERMNDGNKQSWMCLCVCSGVPLRRTWICPAAGGPLWDFTPRAERRAARPHRVTEPCDSRHHSWFEHGRGCELHRECCATDSCEWNGSCASHQQCWSVMFSSHRSQIGDKAFVCIFPHVYQCVRLSPGISLFPASLGDISQFASFTDVDLVSSYLSLNVSSPLALTAGILQAFPRRVGLRWSVVNCSSIFARQALPSWVLYCTGKAAREMMFRVLAAEEPDVKVLSFCPGMYAAMLTTSREVEHLRL